MYYFGTFRHFNRFEKLHALVRRNRLAVGYQTSKIYINGIAYHFASFFYSLPPCMTTWKGGDKRMISAFVRLQDDAVGMGHRVIITASA